MTAGKRVAPAPMAWAGCASVGQQAADVARAITVSRVDDWVLGAQPGACLLYGIGYSAAEASAAGVAARLRDLCEAGLVMIVAAKARPRDRNFPYEFRAIRTGLPVPPKWPDLPPPPVKAKRVATAKVPPRKA
jgi:hypothetical protein